MMEMTTEQKPIDVTATDLEEANALLAKPTTPST